MRSSDERGIRFSLTDGVVIIAAGVGTIWLHITGFPLWWLVPMVLIHFFLFCNVFRVWRKWELIWAGVFVINEAIHLANGYFGWMSPLLWQLPISLIVILLQVRSPYYRGIAASKLNPNGPTAT